MECHLLTSGIPSVKWRNQGSQLQSIYISATAGMQKLSYHINRYLSKKELASGDFSESLKWWDTAIAAHKAAGMEFGYHNHAHEFNKVEGTVMLDYMLQNTDPECVFFQLDVYWAAHGNASPVEYFSNYPGRWKVLHIKDKKEIGQSGLVGFDAIFNNCSGSGMTEYIIEIENCPGETALDALRKSADYLKAAPFVKAEY